MKAKELFEGIFKTLKLGKDVLLEALKAGPSKLIDASYGSMGEGSADVAGAITGDQKIRDYLSRKVGYTRHAHNDSDDDT